MEESIIWLIIKRVRVDSWVYVDEALYAYISKATADERVKDLKESQIKQTYDITYHVEGVELFK